jgi:hypothetical protein
MPRQSDSAENNPGEKAMMRKLAVTVFALSLAALGCGSDSGNKTNPDTGVGAEAGKNDTVIPGPETQADAPIGPEVPLDTAKVDVPAVDTPQALDAPQTDLPSQPLDTAKPVDGPGIDSVKPVVDGGVDSQPSVDTGSALDAGAMDTGSKG